MTFNGAGLPNYKPFQAKKKIKKKQGFGHRLHGNIALIQFVLPKTWREQQRQNAKYVHKSWNTDVQKHIEKHFHIVLNSCFIESVL